MHFGLFMIGVLLAMVLPAFLNDWWHGFGEYDDGAWRQQGWRRK